MWIIYLHSTIISKPLNTCLIRISRSQHLHKFIYTRTEIIFTFPTFTLMFSVFFMAIKTSLPQRISLFHLMQTIDICFLLLPSLEWYLLFISCDYYLLSLKYVATMTFWPFSFSALYGYIRLLLQVKGYQRKNLTLVDVFQRNAARQPNKPCIFFEDQEWTFNEVIEKLYPL